MFSLENSHGTISHHTAPPRNLRPPCLKFFVATHKKRRFFLRFAGSGGAKVAQMWLWGRKKGANVAEM